MTTFKWQADKVRIRSTPETEAARVAALTGIVVGETRPSASGEPVIGPCPDDFAIAVLISQLGHAVWVSPQLLERLGSELVTGAFGVSSPTEQDSGKRFERDPLRWAIDWLLARLGLRA